MQEAKGKRSSNLDGVKIWENETDWVLMIPDQIEDRLHLYVQAEDTKAGSAMVEKYESYIREWM